MAVIILAKFPYTLKKNSKKALKVGARKENIDGFEIEVLKKDPKAYKYEEYWEYPKRYWGIKK